MPTDANHAHQHTRADRQLLDVEQAAVHDTVKKAYRWQYIVTGVQEPRFAEVLRALVTPEQMDRIGPEAIHARQEPVERGHRV